MTRQQMRQLLAEVAFSSDPERVMRISAEYSYLFMPPGIERDSEVAVQLVNKRYRSSHERRTEG